MDNIIQRLHILGKALQAVWYQEGGHDDDKGL